MITVSPNAGGGEVFAKTVVARMDSAVEKVPDPEVTIVHRQLELRPPRSTHVSNKTEQVQDRIECALRVQTSSPK